MTKTVIEPKSKPLTHKEQKLIQGIAMGKTKQESAMEAYNASTPESASVIASNTLKKVNVQQALAEAFKRHGIDIDTSTKPIADALKAIKIQKIDIQDKDTGEITEKVVQMPDHSIRLNASWKAFTLMGMTSPQEGGVTNIQFINVINEQTNKYGI